jgi:hypothetical protein
LEEVKKVLSDDAFIPARLDGGREIPGWFANKYTGNLFNEWCSTQKSFRNKEVLNQLLTEAEIIVINGLANEVWSEQKDAERFQKAEKVLADNWTGRVFWSDEFYEDVDSFLDRTEEENTPDFIWAVDESEPVLQLDADYIVENDTEDRAYEDFSISDLSGFEEFQNAVQKFNEQNKDVIVFRPSYKVAILLK